MKASVLNQKQQANVKRQVEIIYIALSTELGRELAIADCKNYFMMLELNEFVAKQNLF